MDPLRAEFLKYVFSKDVQTAVLKDGYCPVSADLAANELREVGVK